MTKATNNQAPHDGEKEAPAVPKSDQTFGIGAPPQQSGDPEQPGKEGAGNPLNQDMGDGKVPSEKPSFSSFKDEPLATAGIVGSEDPKGRVRPGGSEVPSDSPEADTDPESGYLEHPDRRPAKKRDSAV
jgi:hypothetical protein